MRRTLSVLAVASVAVLISGMLAVSALAGGSVYVKGEVAWTFANLEVTQGATYDISVNGYVHTAKIPYFHVPGVSKSANGPAGQPDTPCLAAYENDINGECVVAHVNFGALVGFVVDPDTGMAEAAPFLIGADSSFVAPAGGVLFLTINDLNLSYADNSGQFTVVITPR